MTRFFNWLPLLSLRSLAMTRFFNWLPLLTIALVLTIAQPWQHLSRARSISPASTADLDDRQSQTAQLVPGSVSDGDTLRVMLNDRETRIRLCGIDAPEREQPFGIAARDHLRSLINQGDGSIIVVPVEEDRFGRLVAELFVQPRSGEEIAINAQMVLDGYAHHYAQYSDSCPNGALLEAIEGEAQSAQRGLWSRPNPVRPWDYRRSR